MRSAAISAASAGRGSDEAATKTIAAAARRFTTRTRVWPARPRRLQGSRGPPAAAKRPACRLEVLIRFALAIVLDALAFVVWDVGTRPPLAARCATSLRGARVPAVLGRGHASASWSAPCCCCWAASSLARPCPAAQAFTVLETGMLVAALIVEALIGPDLRRGRRTRGGFGRRPKREGFSQRLNPLDVGFALDADVLDVVGALVHGPLALRGGEGQPDRARVVGLSISLVTTARLRVSMSPLSAERLGGVGRAVRLVVPVGESAADALDRGVQGARRRGRRQAGPCRRSRRRSPRSRSA